ncbi:hypothetical protein ACRE_067000 [Hapsidospora chrysogenum ATCC 11550]|uniref:Uncharacterized protein n=1 Tax=Hapsidospora chrysogenum (strain ATCC 11550 / CBS 779.69 / DSM 880 / IAM 14645 / JCM 23072 / IMI 49137) TaxID=857340 RepID=A0A086SZN4_HAPC1|nr:hypothetical protein ACRE_067000 [Hapsidospora chrysogenum ATCC 11550]
MIPTEAHAAGGGHREAVEWRECDIVMAADDEGAQSLDGPSSETGWDGWDATSQLAMRIR